MTIVSNAAGAPGNTLVIKEGNTDWYPNSSTAPRWIREDLCNAERSSPTATDWALYEANNPALNDRYFAWSTRFGQEFASWSCDPTVYEAHCGNNPWPNPFNVISQWHHYAANGTTPGSPPLAVGLGPWCPTGGSSCTRQYKIALQWTGDRGSTMHDLWGEQLQPDHPPATPGGAPQPVWYNFTVHIHFATDSTGFVELRESSGNSTTIPKTDIKLACPDNTVNYRCNLATLDTLLPQSFYCIDHYRDNGITDQTTLYHHGILVGTSLADVEPATAPDFTIAPQAATVSSGQGGTASTGLTLSSQGGFSGQVTISATVTGGPAASVAGSPVSVPANGTASATLNLSAQAAAPGTYPVTVTAVSGALSHSTTVNYTVTASANSAMGTLTDAFAGTAVDATLWNQFIQTGSINEGNGSVNLVLAPNSGTNSIGVRSKSNYTLVNSAALVKVPQVVTAGGNADMQFFVIQDSSHHYEWVFENGSLYAKASNGGPSQTLTSIPYSSATHLWWRIRDSGGSVYWDTSADGLTWTQQWSAAELFRPSSVQAYLYAETYGSGSAAPGTASFANFNVLSMGGCATGCMSSLSDPFAASSVDGSKWTVTTTTGSSVTESGGTLNLAPAASTPSQQADINSVAAYTAVGSGAQVEVPQVLTATAGSQAMMLIIDGRNYLGWWYENGSLAAVKMSGGVQTSYPAVTYLASTHRFWRIREQGGTVFFETSANGNSWTQQTTIPTSSVGFSLGALHLRFHTETWSSGDPTPGVAEFAHLN